MAAIGLYSSLAESGELKKLTRTKLPKFAPQVESKIMTESDPEDPQKDNYGDLPLIQSVTATSKKYYSLSSLSLDLTEPV
jgi:hypothetical protein